MNSMLALSVICVVLIGAAQADPIEECPNMECDYACGEPMCPEGEEPVSQLCECCSTCGTLIPVGGACPMSYTAWQCAEGSVCMDGYCDFNTGGQYWPGSS